MNHNEICHEVLSNKFETKLKKGCFHFQKMKSPYIVLYEWKDGFAYRAQYKCLPHDCTLAQACIYIESNFKIKDKRGEYMMFCDTLKNKQVEQLEIRELELGDEQLLEAMKAKCSVSEVEVAQLSIHDIHPIGGFINGELIGASSILSLWGAYDIGIIVEPNSRKKGISSALVYANAKWAHTQEYPSMYRCDEDNIASYHCGLSLGYQEDVKIIVYELEK